MGKSAGSVSSGSDWYSERSAHGLGPTDVEPLVDPYLQLERAPQEDPLLTPRPQHCRTQSPIGSCQNSATPADLGHLVEGCVVDLLSLGE
jgi:hypothetical protein